MYFPNRVTTGDNTVVGINTVTLLILSGKVWNTSYIYYFFPESHLQKYFMELGPVILNADGREGVLHSIIAKADGGGEVGYHIQFTVGTTFSIPSLYCTTPDSSLLGPITIHSSLGIMTPGIMIY